MVRLAAAVCYWVAFIMMISTAAAAESDAGRTRMLTPPEVWSTYDPDAGEFNEEVLKRWSEKGADYKEVYFNAYINGQTVRVYGIYATPTDRGRPARTEEGGRDGRGPGSAGVPARTEEGGRDGLGPGSAGVPARTEEGGRDGRGPGSAGVPARTEEGGRDGRGPGSAGVPARTEEGGRDGRGPVPAVMHLHGGGQTVNKQWLAEWTARGYAALTCNYHGVWENRERFTLYPEALKQGNHKQNAGKEMATTPTVRESSWYIWSAVARRALSYLRQQPEVDRERIGAFGISMGGTTIWSFAMDPRLKAACAIYGCGWNRYYRHTPRYASPAPGPEMTEDDRVWLTGMAPEAYPPFIKCPVLFLSATNDHHGNMDRAYETLDRLPPGVERRQAFTPRFCHHIGADFDQDLIQWMDTWLKGGPAWPKSPVAKVTLGPDGVPVVTITPDQPAEVDRVSIFCAVENPRPVSRNWRNATAVRSGDAWQAALPVLNADAYLFAFANVRYKSGVHLSSNEEAVIPSKLGAAKATDAVASVLYDGSDGTGMWVTGSPCTDPVPVGRIPVPIRPATGPDGKAGFTVDPHSTPMTYQPGDPKWRAPEGAALQFKIATKTGESFKVSVHENYFWPGQKTYEASVRLDGKPGWQTVTLQSADFREKKHDGVQGEAPSGFTHCDALQWMGPWTDTGIVFTDIQWVSD